MKTIIEVLCPKFFQYVVITVPLLFLVSAAALPASAQGTVCASTPPCVMFQYYDDQTEGFSQAEVMIANSRANDGYAGLSSSFQNVLSFYVAGHNTTYGNFGQVQGGPVFVSGPAVVTASQRRIFNGEFSETYGQNITAASTSLWLNWYDQYDSGYYHDDIYVSNPSGSPITATVTLGSNTHTLSIPAWGVAYTNFPGVVGGPVQISSSSPVLASARVTYDQSFSEVNAVPTSSASTDIIFPWYDQYNAGYSTDGIYISNPSTTTTATATVSLSSVYRTTVTVPPGSTVATSIPRNYGAYLEINSSSPVISSQRVVYYDSFNEVYGQALSQASTALVLNWYDNYNTGYTENVHLANQSSSAATVEVSLGTTTKTVTVNPGTATYTSFPGQYGGPVLITSNVPIVASGRTVYNIGAPSFNEVNAVPQP